MGLGDWYVPPADWPDHVLRAAKLPPELEIGLEVEQVDAELIEQLATSIMARWRARAQTVPPIRPATAFKAYYQTNERNAIAAIVAILELVQAVGAGKPLHDKGGVRR